MKKLILGLLLFCCFTSKAQNPICTQTVYPFCIPFQNTDMLQLYNLTAIKSGSTSVTGTVSIKDNSADTLNNRLAQLVKSIQRLCAENSLVVTSTVQTTPGTYTIGPTSARIDFMTGSVFTGSINGIPYSENTSITFPAINIRPYDPMIYTVTTGTITINQTK